MMTEYCGPHCGIKDGHEGHCSSCHSLGEDYRIRLETHVRTVRLVRLFTSGTYGKRHAKP